MNEPRRLDWTCWLATGRMPVVLLVVVVGSSVLTEGRFLQVDNLINVLRQVSLQAMVGFGMTLVIVTGGIDLSVGSLVALTGVVAAMVMRAASPWPPEAAIVAGLVCGVAAGAGAGATSGMVIARFGIPPFIVTLAGMLIARGFAFILCDGQPIHELPASLLWWGRGFVFESALGRLLPVPVVIMLAGYVVALLLFHRTVFGRCIVAVGSNELAAYLAGIRVRSTKLLVYALTGAVCGLAGVLHDAKLMAGDPTAWEMWELDVIAAVVVGGTSLFGGRGTITGTLIGALIIGALNNSLNLMSVQHFWQKVVLGAVILGASLLDSGLRRLEPR